MTAGEFQSAYVAGVAAGALLPELLEPPEEPLDPPMFGQFAPFIAPWLGRPDGAVPEPLEPPPVDGACDADGSGLAAETTAAAPPTRSRPDSIAVATTRLRLKPDAWGAPESPGDGSARGIIGAAGGGVRGAGIAGSSCHSNVDLLGVGSMAGCECVMRSWHLRALGSGVAVDGPAVAAWPRPDAPGSA